MVVTWSLRGHGWTLRGSLGVLAEPGRSPAPANLVGAAQSPDVWFPTKISGSPKWMVYNGTSIYKWMIWGYPHDFGNPHIWMDKGIIAYWAICWLIWFFLLSHGDFLKSWRIPKSPSCMTRRRLREKLQQEMYLLGEVLSTCRVNCCCTCDRCNLTPLYGGFSGQIIYTWWIFHCHV